MNLLLLCPFAAVRDYLYPMVALGRDLKSLGHEMTFVHCDRAMSGGCTAMNALGVPDEAEEKDKTQICDRCIKSAKAAETLRAWEVRWLLPTNKRLFTRLSQSESAFLRKAAAYELLLQFKCETVFKKKHLNKLVRKRNLALRQLWPQAEMIMKEKKYNAIICYNSLYGVNRLFWKIAKKKKIPFLSLHHSHNAALDNEFTLVRDDIFLFLRNLQKKFFILPSPSAKFKEAVQHHDQAMQSSRKIWSYSSAKKAEKLKAPLTKYKNKVLVCLSSPDEVFAAQYIGVVPKGSDQHVFCDQIDWLRWLSSLAKHYPDVLFWVRPHPRLYPNKREGKVSDLAQKLEEIRKRQAPENFFWPDLKDQGSVWTHLEDTTVFFNAWSTLADDFGKRGIPVITFFPQFSNSGSKVDYSARSLPGYETLFSKILQNPEKYSNSLNHEKWRGYYLCENTFRLLMKRNPIFRLLKNLSRHEKRIKYDLMALFWANYPLFSPGNIRLKDILSKNLEI